MKPLEHDQSRPHMFRLTNYGESVSSGKNRAILAGSPNPDTTLSLGLTGVGGPASAADCPGNDGKSLSDILFFLILPCAGGLACELALVSGQAFTDLISGSLGWQTNDTVARSGRGGAE